jgi:PiT family inorganic phosphate transporter
MLGFYLDDPNAARAAGTPQTPDKATPVVADLLALAILPSFQNKGIGTKLLLHVIEVAERVAPQSRISSLRLTVAHKAECEGRYAGRVFGIPGQRVVDVGHFVSAGVVSFARGLNDTPKIAAVLLASPILGPQASLVAVAAAMAIGGFVGARRVAETMSHKVTTMSTGQGLSASLATGSLVLAASVAGLPVSTTHVSVGSLVGIGAMNGQADFSVIRNIVLSWVATLPIAAVLSALVYLLARP